MVCCGDKVFGDNRGGLGYGDWHLGGRGGSGVTVSRGQSLNDGRDRGSSGREGGGDAAAIHLPVRPSVCLYDPNIQLAHVPQ